MMEVAVISDMDLQVQNDNGIKHVMLRIGPNVYDITEMVFMDELVEAAIVSLEAMEE